MGVHNCIRISLSGTGVVSDRAAVVCRFMHVGFYLIPLEPERLLPYVVCSSFMDERGLFILSPDVWHLREVECGMIQYSTLWKTPVGLVVAVVRNQALPTFVHTVDSTLLPCISSEPSFPGVDMVNWISTLASIGMAVGPPLVYADQAYSIVKKQCVCNVTTPRNAHVALYLAKGRNRLLP